MKNIQKNLKSWHIYVIVAAVFLLSLIAWAKCFKYSASTIISDFKAKQEAVETVQADTNETETTTAEAEEDNAIITAINLCKHPYGTTIDLVSTNWTMFKQYYFIKVDELVTYLVTGEISTDDVVIGTDRWLFYLSKTDGSPVADYEGTDYFSQKELDEALSAAEAVQSDMEARGIQLAIIIPPNKENVYAEYVPDTYTHNEPSRADCLVDYLKNNGINILTSKEELQLNHRDYQLYYSYDTHWNQLGAYIGVKNVLQSWGMEMPALRERAITSEKLNYHYGGTDDIANMIGARFLFSDELEYTVDGTAVMDWNQLEYEQNNSVISQYHNDNAENEAKVLIAGDSFRTSMVPALREHFPMCILFFDPILRPACWTR